jgi:hypothetical protein
VGDGADGCVGGDDGGLVAGSAGGFGGDLFHFLLVVGHLRIGLRGGG